MPVIIFTRFELRLYLREFEFFYSNYMNVILQMIDDICVILSFFPFCLDV